MSASTHLWLDGIGLRDDIGNVQCNLEPSFDGLGLGRAGGVSNREDDLSRSELVGKSTFGRSSSGLVGDLNISDAHGRLLWTYQEVLQNLSSGLVLDQLCESHIRSLEDEVVDVRVLREQRMGEWHGDILLQSGESLLSVGGCVNIAHQIPSFLLDSLEVRLVDDAPHSGSLTLQTALTSTEGQVESDTLGSVKGRFNDSLAEINDESSEIVVRSKLDSGVETEHVSSTGRVAQVLGGTRRGERSSRGKVGSDDIVKFSDAAVSG